MKKIIKNNLLGFILGAVIFGSIGVVATNYLLRAEDVEYVDKDNNSTTVQSAITDLYNKAKKGGFETLPIGTVTKTYNSITVPYTGNYDIAYCIYGTGNSYGNVGTIKNGACEIKNLISETSYDYKIIAADSTGKVYEGHGTIETDEAPDFPIIVYFNPITNQKCTNYIETNSNTGTKTGCMKWYAYKLENNKYTMILDHNTTATVAYNTTNSNENYGTDSGNIGYDLALLTTSTSSGGSGWNSNLNPRLITANEIASIVGYTSWNSASSTDYFYFDSKNQTQTANATNKSEYAWLFDYTKNCTSYGCNTADSSTYGYWTNSKKYGNSYYVWAVRCNGFLSYYDANGTYNGLRPVIEVPKAIFN